MPSFEFVGRDASGTEVRGVEVGADSVMVAATLAARGLAVDSLHPAMSWNDPLAGPVAPAVRAAPVEVPRAQQQTLDPAPIPEGLGQRSYVATSVAGPLIGQVPLPALAFFFRQAATMVGAGVPMVQLIGTLAGQSTSPKLKSILRETGSAVEQGLPMSAIFQRYPEVFTPLQVSLLRAGEQGGFLDRALHQIADYLDRDIELKRLYRSVTLMPKIQVVASIIIILGANLIISIVAPGGKGLSSPLTEPAVWMILAPILVGLFIFFRVGLANPRLKHNWDFFVSLVPGWGKVAHQFAMARWGRAFGALYKGGVPIPEAFRLAAEACGDERVRSLLSQAPLRLQEGHGIADTLRETQAFSPIVLDMVATGETTGSLDQMLESMSNFYEQEAAAKARQLATMTGVVVGVMVAIYIGYIVIKFYTGMFSGLMKDNL